MKLLITNCSPDEAQPLAKRLVEERLAACVNVFDAVTSFYRWEGELCEDQEVTLLIKTTPERCDELAQKLADYHSYDVPEIVVVDPTDVSEPYAEWVHDQVR